MRASIWIGTLVTCLALPACGPDENEPGRNISFSVFAGSDIVIFQGVPEENASLLVSGEVLFFEDISDLVLGQASVTLSADGVDVATAECGASFRNPPAGESGRESFDIDCAFTNAAVDALCAASVAGIEVLVRSNLGDYQGPVEALEVQCFPDRRRPDVMALSSDPSPAGKVCRLHDGDEYEVLFGYADGLLAFEDEYSGADFVGRVAYFYNVDGTLSESVSVDADGWWYLIRTYEYTGSTLASISSEWYPDAPTTCSHSFTDNDQTWLVHCDSGDKTSTWDPLAKTIVHTKDTVDFTLSYTGDLQGPTQWFSVPLMNYLNDFHPVDDVGEYNGQAIITTYTYDANDRIIEAASTMGGAPAGSIFYAYDCQ